MSERLDAGSSTARLIILSVIISAACLLYLFPLHYLAGSGRYWNNPANEVNISLAALRYYISENKWLPLGLIRDINTPEGINILYENSIPLFSLASKIAYQTLGVKINTIYIWSLVCTILQGVSFAYLIIVLNGRSYLNVILASIVGMLMPSYIWRLESAVALPTFLILFSLAYYFIISRSDSSSRVVRRAITLSAILVSVSILLNPYITAMIVPVFVVSLAHATIAKKITLFELAKIVLLVVVSMIAFAHFFGYFAGGDLRANAGGFDFFSMNLVGPFDPGYSTIFKLFLPNLSPVDATGGQAEGMQYLGMGWLLLIVIALILNGVRTIYSARAHYLLMAALVGMALYSISSKIYFGNTLLVAYRLPPSLASLTETFRASGRFFWPMGYLLVAGAVVTTMRRQPRSAPFILCIAIALQAYDTSALRQSLWNILSGVNKEGKVAVKYTSPYDVGGIPSTVMNDLIKTHKAIRQYPSWWCGGLGNQLYEEEVNFIASRYLVSQNSFYTGRENKDCYAEDAEERNISVLSPETLYIFAQRYSNLGRLHRQGVDLRACRILKLFGGKARDFRVDAKDSLQSASTPIICSEKFKPQQYLAELTKDVPPKWPYGGLFPVDAKKFADEPVVRRVSASGSYDKKLFPPENVIDGRVKEDNTQFPDYWIAPNWTSGWVRLDLNGSYSISEVQVMNTHNGGAGDRAAATARVEFYGKDGAISYLPKVLVSDFPQWTKIKVNPPISAHAVKIFVTKGGVHGTGLNEVRLIGSKAPVEPPNVK